MPSIADRRSVCYVTDGSAFSAENRNVLLLERIAAAIAAGVNCVQIREKQLPSRSLLDLAREAVGLAAEARAGVRVIVNDRVDAALAAGAGGVHLGRESLPSNEVDEWCRKGNAPAGFVVGVSCHSIDEARAAELLGADYVFFGPIFDTPAKRKFGEPQGVARLQEVCRAVRIPIFAIGGIDEKNAINCFDAGATGVAAIRLFQEHTDLRELAKMVHRLRANQNAWSDFE